MHFRACMGWAFELLSIEGFFFDNVAKSGMKVQENDICSG